jgi:hypothetical protein
MPPEPADAGGCNWHADPPQYYYNGQPGTPQTVAGVEGTGGAGCSRPIKDIHLHVRLYCYAGSPTGSAAACGTLDDKHGTGAVSGRSIYPNDGNVWYIRTHVAVVFEFFEPTSIADPNCSPVPGSNTQVACYAKSTAFAKGPAFI